MNAMAIDEPSDPRTVDMLAALPAEDADYTVWKATSSMQQESPRWCCMH